MARPIVVIGGGTVGLAVTWSLARRGVAPVCLERHRHVHDFGSHSGFTRVIRQAYHEGSNYVPLVREADAAWTALGARRGVALLVRTGILEFGPADDPDLAAAVAACQDHDIAHECFGGRALQSRWPFRLPNAWSGCFTPSGGYLRVIPCLNALRDEATAAGAQFRYGAQVQALTASKHGIAIELASGETVQASRVVVAAGAGLADVRPELGRSVRCLRRVQVWTDPPQPQALAELPVWVAFDPGGFFYGFPWMNEGVRGLKLACHRAPSQPRLGTVIDPESLERTVDAEDLAPLDQFVARTLPSARGPFVDHRVCIYTVTPDWDFLIDRDPSDPRIVIAAGFSGHGFKFAPAVGELVAKLVLDEGRAAPPMFALDRLRAPA